MKTTFILLTCFLNCITLQGQDILKRIEDRAKRKANERIDRTIDKGLDKADKSLDSSFSKKEKKNINKPVIAETSARGAAGTAAPRVRVSQRSSFLDFVPGNQVIFEDHFEKDALMDFPANWNTTGTGKVITVDGFPGRWFEVSHNSVVNPVLKKALPENCTIEFDLILLDEGERRTPNIDFGLTPVKDILKEDLYYKDKFYTTIRRYNEKDGRTLEYGLREVVGNKNEFPLPSYVNNVLRVSMAINKTRIRVYLDQTKILDLPRALTDPMRNNFFLTNGYVIPASELPMVFGNIRIASGNVDARSLLIKQLMEEGKAVTSDILFDVSSDVIKPASYDIIKQFGDALVANPSLKIKIIGHTDSDGGDAENVSLSQKRAAAVKMYITENYAVAGSRIQTDGKGEAQPVAPNTNSDGKAKNRRVEFVKL
ncbi:OmpA family protein [Chitinophaga sp. SYP-B3965]|uniref:OmpA family protein n=1 Tax=Chitinophaga sp. SYP-B3965 TaxID=2663120 RepID=UPI001299820A|nr:OmpA family protein [Chitinophaga sp. SYP-B3965]MRG48597.1 OmpA family protein [Chitinophaga sp. SYP-B3965]